MKLNFCIPLLAFSLAFFSLLSCEKDPQIITKIITETDTLFITHHDTVIVQLTDTLTLTEFINDTATTFILVRHAETSGAGADPSLSAEGQERANELVRVLKNVSLGAVFSTNFNRTKQTASPVGADKGISPQNYDGFNLTPLVNEVLENYHGGVVLVVGHSNTTPNLLNLLTGTNDFAQIPEAQYDNFYLVTVFEKGRAEVAHLKYGKETP